MNELVIKISERLMSESERLGREFADSVAEVGVRYCALDDLLPEDLALRIHAAFPTPARMRLMKSYRETKYTSKSFDEFDPILKEATFAIQSPEVIRVVERITGIGNQIPDPSLYAGGLSMMARAHFLNPHIDNSHDGTRRYYRTLNLLYYVTPDWELESGGNLELWDRDVRRSVTIVSKFNRLVIMETHPWSWHSVSPVRVDDCRCCVSNYYFSPRSPTGEDYFNVTSFSARPEQRFGRLVARLDNFARQAARRIVPGGLGRRDVYKGQDGK